MNEIQPATKLEEIERIIKAGGEAAATVFKNELPVGDDNDVDIQPVLDKIDRILKDVSDRARAVFEYKPFFSLVLQAAFHRKMSTMLRSLVDGLETDLKSADAPR